MIISAEVSSGGDSTMSDFLIVKKYNIGLHQRYILSAYRMRYVETAMVMMPTRVTSETTSWLTWPNEHPKANRISGLPTRTKTLKTRAGMRIIESWLSISCEPSKIKKSMMKKSRNGFN